jgi:hypothetical protein
VFDTNYDEWIVEIGVQMKRQGHTNEEIRFRLYQLVHDELYPYIIGTRRA